MVIVNFYQTFNEQIITVVSVRAHQRNRNNRKYVYVCICWQAEIQERWWCSSNPNAGRLETWKEVMFKFETKGGKKPISQLKTVRQKELPLTWRKVSLFVLFRPSANWMRPTRIRESNLVYSVYQFKCWSHPKYPPQIHLE